MVGNDVIAAGQSPGAFHHCLEHEGIYIPHLTRFRDSLYGDQFISGGEDPYHWPTEYGHLRRTHGRQRADILRRKQPSGGKDRVSRVEVIAPKNNIAARDGGFTDTDGTVSIILRIFQHDYRIRPGWHGSAGGDRRAGPWSQTAWGAFAHGDFFLQRQDGRDGSGATKRIRCPDGVPVHCGAVKPWYEFLAFDWLE